VATLLRLLTENLRAMPTDNVDALADAIELAMPEIEMAKRAHG
jgi:hypothetical protein